MREAKPDFEHNLVMPNELVVMRDKLVYALMRDVFQTQSE